MGSFNKKNKNITYLVKYKMASTKSVNVVRQVKPLLSVSKNEARLRTLALYKAWQRQVPFICDEYDIQPSQKMVREKVKEKFMVNANVKDFRVVDMLVVKGQQDLQEIVEKWQQAPHIMSKYFAESYEARPKDFMSKFLTGSD